MRNASATLLACLALCVAAEASAQGPRKDAIWARRAAGGITLNGNLNEPAWAKAESMTVVFGVDNGIPGSGWKYEGGVVPDDPSNATLKFLVVGNQLYLGARIRDKSVGGDSIFNRFDGLLMSVKDHNNANFPKPPAEYLYSWWYPGNATPRAVGKPPSFKGVWANEPPGSARTPEQIAAWDAVTIVNGTANSDAVDDVGYTVEMRFDLAAMGYDVTRGKGDIIEWNVSIYDCDWFWPLNVARFASNRVWWQSPWGNAQWYDEVHIYARPDVTVNSTILPPLRPELYVPNGAAFAAPTVDGNLTEPVWNSAYRFDIRYGDLALRAGYPGVGPSRSGQYQPTVNGGQAAILDPADATVRLFFRGNNLYFGFDVRDQVVQSHPNPERMDGFIVTIDDRAAMDPLDNVLRKRRLTLGVSPTGTAQASDYLLTLQGMAGASSALVLKAGTTVDTLGQTADTGYTAEIQIDLTKLGYPSGLGDGFLFLGVDHYDGDSFLPFTDSYATRTWWFREREGECCPIWAYMATSPPTDAIDPEPEPEAVSDARLLGSFPNPAKLSTIRYSLPRSSAVTLEVYDVSGKLVRRQKLGAQGAGIHEVEFDGSDRAAGVYLYRLGIVDPTSGRTTKTLSGRLIVLR